MQKLFPIVNTKSDTELFADLDATVAWAKSQGGDSGRLGIQGFCRGGRTVWHYSTHNPNLRRVSLSTAASSTKRGYAKERLDLAGGEGARARPLRGGRRRHPARRWRRWKSKLQAAGKTAAFQIYPGAPHGFHADYRGATARRPPRTPGTRRTPGSRNTKCSAERPNLRLRESIQETSWGWNSGGGLQRGAVVELERQLTTSAGPRPARVAEFFAQAETRHPAVGTQGFGEGRSRDGY